MKLTFKSKKIGIVGQFHKKGRKKKEQINKVGKSRTRLKACNNIILMMIHCNS